jgi:hypothetical protein
MRPQLGVYEKKLRIRGEELSTNGTPAVSARKEPAKTGGP